MDPQHDSGHHVIQPAVEPKKSHVKKGVFALVAMLLLFAAGFAGYATKPASAPGPNPDSNSSNAGTIIIKNVAIHRPASSDPYPTILAAGGHYLIEPAAASHNIVYDGKTIYNKSDLCVGGDGCFTLSKNGLHYAYLTNDTKNQSKLFIDGNYIKSLPINSTLTAVSNDGKSYMYSALTSDLQSELLYRDGKMLYKSPNGFLVKIVSADLSNYIASSCMLRLTQTGCDQYAIILNGKSVFTSGKYNNNNPDTALNGNWLSAIAMSENGKHYAYFTPPAIDPSVSYNVDDGGTLYIDGKLKPDKGNGGAYDTQTTGQVSTLTVTDAGAVAFVDLSGVYVYTPTEVDAGGQAKLYPKAGNTQVFMNDDASQVLLNYVAGNTNINVSNDNAWILNGKTLQVPQYTRTANFSGNTLYIDNYN